MKEYFFKNFKKFKSGYTIIETMISISLFIVIILIRIFRGQPTSQLPVQSTNPFANQPVDDQTTIKSAQVLEVTPLEGTILNPGENLKVSIKFSQTVDADNLGVNLKASDIGGDGLYKTIDFSLETIDSNTLNLTFKEAILSFHNYNLTIYSKEGQKLLQVTWVSDRTEIIKETDNNPSLAQYLPYKTSNFTLSFVPDKNLYVFSFSYDSNSEESIDAQYDKAKLQAEEFIRSKGIDLESIKIEWRYH